MRNPLHQQLASLRQRARRSIWLFGLSCVICVAVGLCLLIGYLDSTWHINHAVTRLLIGCLGLCLIIYVAWRNLVLPLRTSMSDVDLARRLESRFPELQERLLSATEFSEHHCSRTVGSTKLQQQLIDDACQSLVQIDTRHALNLKRVQQSTLILIGSIIVFATAIGLYPTTSYTALRRFATPFRAPEWPQQDKLILVEEDLQPRHDQTFHFPISQPIKLYVLNRSGRIPSDAKILYRITGKTAETHELKLNPLTSRNAEGKIREIGYAELQSDTRELYFRAVGGDDFSMPWRKAIFFPTPELKTVEVQVIPPEYTGLPESKQSVNKLKPVLENSRLIISGRISANQTKLHSAQVLFSHRPNPYPARILSDGRTLLAEIELQEKGNYEFQIQVTDANQLQNQNVARHQIQVLEDVAPTVSITKPAATIEATAKAAIPLRIVAKDDVSLRQIRLQYRIGQSSQQETMSVPLETMTGLQPAATVQLDWMLQALTLPTGTIINYFAEASDDYPGESIRWSSSQPQQIRIVSAEQKQLSLNKQQVRLLDQLKRIRQLQKNNLMNTIEIVNRLNAPDLNRTELPNQIKGLTVNQRQINSQLAGSPQSLQSQTERIQNDLRNQGFQKSKSVARLQQLLNEIAFLHSHWLTESEHQLTLARKQAEHVKLPIQKLNQLLSRVTVRQQQAVNSLDRLINLLAEWQNSKSISSALAEMREEQITINKQTSELGQKTLARSVNILTNAEKRKLLQLSLRQRQQSEKHQQLREMIEKLLMPLSGDQPEQNLYTTDALQHFLQALNESNLQSVMNEAAAQIQKNQIGRAFVTQNQILESIKTLERALLFPSTQQDNDFTEIQKLEQSLLTLITKQKQLQLATSRLSDKKTNGPQNNSSDSLIKDQQYIQSQSEALAQKLLQANLAMGATWLTKAVIPMKSAMVSLERPDLKQAAWQQNRAHQFLFKAWQTLQYRLIDAQQNTQQILLQQLISDVTNLKQQQEEVQKSTNQLHQQFEKSERWTRPMRKQLRDLTDKQSEISAQSKQLAEQSHSQIASKLKWKQALQSMKQTMQQLKQRQTDKQTQAHQQNASDQLAAILKILATANQALDREDLSENKWTRSLQSIKSKQSDLQAYTKELESLKTSDMPQSIEPADYQYAAEHQQKTSEHLQREIEHLISQGVKSPQSKPIDMLRQQTKKIINEMQKAAEKLNQQKSDSSTQSHQQQALTDLSDMIAQLNQNAHKILKTGNQNPNEQSTANNEQSPNQQINNQQPATANSAAQQAGNKQSPINKKSTQLEISQELLMNEIWGHLPPRLRNRMLNVYREKYLPKYEKHIEKYYEDLAQPAQSQNKP